MLLSRRWRKSPACARTKERAVHEHEEQAAHEHEEMPRDTREQEGVAEAPGTEDSERREMRYRGRWMQNRPVM